MSGVRLSSREPIEAPERTTAPRAVVYGCAGLRLTAEEHAFFRAADPFGYILFRRNCESPAQVRALVTELRAASGRPDAAVLIDQEGGRVARLRPPRWPAYPPAQCFGELAGREPAQGREAAWMNARLLGQDLIDLGITVDCAPVCDVPTPECHDIIGDRAFADDPAVVADLARATCEGLLDAGVLPVIKHLPGHGRARVDSHLELPVVEASRAVLAATDFAPFRALADMPLGMVAHVVYRALDPDRPASTSPVVIAEVVRGALGFDGLLFCDDLSMQALSGSMAARARAVLAAGCDIVLHCNGNMAEMTDIAGSMLPLSEAGVARWARAEGLRRQRSARGVGAVDAGALRDRLDGLLGTRRRAG